jgi:alkaline phosphatase D
MSPPPPSRIAFGSCNDQDLENYLWPAIVNREPTAFIWGGDAIYAGECLAPSKTLCRN